MNIGEKLKQARMRKAFTQDEIAETLQITRQTISNWENNRSYPDILYVLQLSELYEMSLDDLLKGDEAMLEHMQDSMDVVSSNRKLVTAIIINIILFLCIIFGFTWISTSTVFIGIVLMFAFVSILFLFYQIIKRF